MSIAVCDNHSPGSRMNNAKLPAAGSGRRTLLYIATITGGAGAVAAAVPFVGSMAPSERARALGAAVEFDTGSLAPGELSTVEWRGRPVWVLRRTEDMLRGLQRHDALLSDPASKRSEQSDALRTPWRSIQPAIAVLVGICTHLGCIPTYRPEAGPDLGADWPGGFLCPCHGSKFDLAGRVFKNVPAPTNLEVPPYKFQGSTRLLIGSTE